MRCAAGGFGEFDGEAGGSANGGHDGKAGHGGLLDEFETGAAADEEKAIAEAAAGVPFVADQLIDGVVTADVFEAGEELALGIEESGGVEGAGGGKGRLVAGEAGGQVEEGSGEEGRIGRGSGRQAGGEHFEGGFAAEAATGSGVGEAFEALPVDGDAGNEVDAPDVGEGGIPGADGGDLGGIGEDALGKQEAGGERGVVAGGAHGDDDVAMEQGAVAPDAEADLERLFNAQLVGGVDGTAPGLADDVHRGGFHQAL